MEVIELGGPRELTVVPLETPTMTVIQYEASPDLSVTTIEVEQQEMWVIPIGDDSPLVPVQIRDQIVVEGPTGPQGPTGPAGGAYYLHVQSVPASTWDIQHDKGVRLNVTLLTDDNEEYFAKVVHDSVNHAFVYHNQPQSGRAVLS